MRGDRFGGRDDKAEIGLALSRQRRRDADEDRVGLAQPGEIVGGGEPPALPQRGDAFRADMGEIRPAGIEPLDLVTVDVEAERGKTVLGRGAQQRQPDIAEPDDADRRTAVAKPADKGVDIERCVRRTTRPVRKDGNRIGHR